MRKSVWIGLSLLAALVLGGCMPVTTSSPSAQTGATPAVSATASASATPAALPTVVVTGTLNMTPTLDATTAVAAARIYLAEQLSITATAVSLVFTEAVEWPDACLGAATPGQMCLQVVTPGYRVIFNATDAAGKQSQYEVHTDATGRVARLFKPAFGGTPEAGTPTADDATAALIWQRSGGIAGICQKLVVQQDGAYVLEDCKRGKVLSQGALPPADATKLADTLKRYGIVVWQPKPPTRGADMFLDTLTLRGRGDNPPSTADIEALSAYLGGLANRLTQQPGAPQAAQTPTSTPAPAAGSGATGQAGSGIEGVAMMGPTCPVERADQPCPDKPFQVTLAVFSGSREVARFQTGTDGRFRVDLPPGVYTVKPAVNAVLPRGASQEVTVVKGQYAVVKMTFDSGIR